jgi:CheY-like chemotaxis protein
MGGRIDIVSRPEQGSCFTVRLPERTRRVSQRTLDAAPEREGPLVLVIDDDQSTYATLSATLSERGFRVEWAGTGDAGLEAARQQRPRVIVLNINMPAKAGWTVLARLKEDAETAPIPVVMVTSLESPDSGMALGATDYLVKPIQPGQLVKAVRRWLTATNDDFTVLVIDDDPSMREIVERTLLSSGYRVTTAANGNEGLLAVEATNPGLIVLDLMMPEMDGFEFLRRLKENPRHFQLPVLVATAKELSESEHRLLAESATRVIQKLAHSRAELMHVVERQVSALCKTRSPNEPPALALEQRSSPASGGN